MSAPSTQKLVYTGEEVAEILQVSKITVWRLLRKGLLKQINGITNRHSAASLNALIAGEKEIKK